MARSVPKEIACTETKQAIASIQKFINELLAKNLLEQYLPVLK